MLENNIVFFLSLKKNNKYLEDFQNLIEYAIWRRTQQ